ncbi:LptF/LptG family permease [Jiulongibacter sediminis]|uniref:LptF/LptG family permease n=1 Tax=Jiulongibacter sediminis TaxID=1605367 RepID=UPI0026F33F10|nr:LptF/LptG family permease [Jiulongibacter sediminis]
MRKIDKLVIKNFLGPFVLTTLVVVFIFLLRFLMLYFDDFVGKDLGLKTFAQLFAYFSLITVPISLPLSTLLAALMSFGNLGEHTELTAIKSAGIPLGRVIMPTLVFTIFISIFSFWFNNNVTPWANLKGYSLLWDIRTTKVALNIQEGIFYREIPGYAIKVKEKLPDNETLKDVIVYNHTQRNGNKNVTVADSGRMYTMYNDHYLVFELYNGFNYSETKTNQGLNDTQFYRNGFKRNRLVFSLESFNMQKTSENQFKYHEYMKNISELKDQIDTAQIQIDQTAKTQLSYLKTMHTYQFKELPERWIVDSLTGDSTLLTIKPGAWIQEKMKLLDDSRRYEEIWTLSQSTAHSFASQLQNNHAILGSKRRTMYSADIERWHKYTYAVACLAMFIIGASLGSIIKKGGFGMPVLIAISFFILYYVMMQLADKNAKEGFIPVVVAVWIPDLILSIIGAIFISKATKDASIFDTEVYAKIWEKFLAILPKKKSPSLETSIE